MPRKKKQSQSTGRKIVRKSKGEDAVISMVDNFMTGWDQKEPDHIHGLYGSSKHSLGVVRSIYSGLPTLDRILSIRRDSTVYGVPLNKMIECYAPEGGCKTSLSLYLCVQFILSGGIAFFADEEKKFDPVWLKTIAKANGLGEDALKKRFRYLDHNNFEDFILWLIRFFKDLIKKRTEAWIEIEKIENKKNKNSSDEEKLLSLKKFMETPIIVVIDSVAAISTKKDMEDDQGSAKLGEIANLLARVLRKIRKHLGYTNTLILFLNQVRDKIDTTGKPIRGSRITTPAGHALKHYCDARFEITRLAGIKRTNKDVLEFIGSEHQVRTVKNQMGVPPFRTAKLRFYNDIGFSSLHSLLETLVFLGKVQKNGRRYVFKHQGQLHEVEQSSIDKVQKSHPNWQKFLHKYYQKLMEQDA